jgi:hypothetical protein
MLKLDTSKQGNEVAKTKSIISFDERLVMKEDFFPILFYLFYTG